MKTLIGIIAFFTLGLFQPQAWAQGIKIGYVDVTRIVETTKEGKAIVTNLKSEFDKKQKELDSRLKAYEEKAKQFQAQMGMLKDEVKKEKMQALAKEEYELGMLARQYQGEINAKKTEALSKLEGKVMGVVQKIAKREGLEYVMRQEMLLHAPGQMDLTNEVIREYDKQHTSTKGK